MIGGICLLVNRVFLFQNGKVAAGLPQKLSDVTDTQIWDWEEAAERAMIGVQNS